MLSEAAKILESIKELGLVGLGATAIYYIGYALRGIRDSINELDARHERSSERNDSAHDKIDKKADIIKDKVDAQGDRLTQVETKVDTICN